jgi:hypothetical protein
LFVYRTLPDGRGFLSLFGLYAMTAPTGWLLALPGEFLFGLETSRLIDLGILALISTWRVVVVIAACQFLRRSTNNRLVDGNQRYRLLFRRALL